MSKDTEHKKIADKRYPVKNMKQVVAAKDEKRKRKYSNNYPSLD